MQDDTRLLQFDLDFFVLGGKNFHFTVFNLQVSDKYKPFYKSCDLLFHDAQNIMSQTFLPNIITNGCVNPLYESEFRMDSFDSPGDVLTWFAPKIFEVKC